jgi:thiamine biosynthesis lipoprotein ApbE
LSHSGASEDLEIRDLAVATSGASERGEHVIDARSGAPPTDLLSATVVGPSLTFADAYATVAFAMGIVKGSPTFRIGPSGTVARPSKIRSIER